MQTELHHDFKRAQGYSEAEIARKRNAERYCSRIRTRGTGSVYAKRVGGVSSSSRRLTLSAISPSAEVAASAGELAGTYAALGRCWEGSAWLRDVVTRAQIILDRHPHGDLAAWLEALRALPPAQCAMNADRAAPRLGNAATDPQHLREVLLRLHPWRKGPLELGGVLIDTEWRSDWKWERVRPFLDLENQRVLDIGCGNGYFGWRMLAAGARW
jgi:hypothetical protein